MRIGIALMLATATSSMAGTAPAKGPKLSADTPYCALPGTRPVFVAPMGQPFRAAPGQPYPAAQWLAAADANRDGAIDRTEFVADAGRFFATIDLDHDGRLTPEEVAAYERDVAPEIALWSASRIQAGDGRQRRRGGGGALGDIGSQLGLGSGAGKSADYGGPMGAGRYGWLNVPEPVASADLDVDRLVSRDEFLAAAARRFATLDTKEAGRLTLADLPRTPAQIALEGPCRPRPKPKRGQVRVDPVDDDDLPPDGRSLR